MLHLALFGPFNLTTADGTAIILATDKVRALLAYLAVEAGRPHRREALAGLLWPDMDDQKARRNLRQTLHRLRQALDEVAPEAGETLLMVDRQVVQLRTGGLVRDHDLFHKALQAVEEHNHPTLESCPDCLQRLESAAALYQGEFFAGFSLDEGETFEDWLLVQREYWHQKALLTLHTLTDMLAWRGDIDATMRCAQRQIALDPYYEPAYQQGMRALARHGLRPQALTLYDQCRQILAADLDVEPAPATTSLWQQIKDGRLEPAPAGQSQTERHHFPTPLTPFIGRQRELSAILTTLADPACRVLTLLGPGGMGKTRLCLQASHELAGGRLYRDHIYYIPLSAVTTEDLLVTTMAQRLGLRLDDQAAPRRQLLAYLRDKEMLLVCDNFEQILNGAALVADIVAQAPQVQFLVTSRQPLNITAEWRQQVVGLDVEGNGRAHGPAGQLPEAVELFLRSAQRMVPNYQLRPDAIEPVLALGRLVGGMPLALEMAAAWVRVMEPAAILRETQKSLDFLSSPLQDRPERHQSVRAVLAQSWQMLDPHLQSILARLALFSGDFALEAVLAILPDATMFDIASLLDHSLLHGRPGGRYEMHELPRQFARSQPQPQAGDFQARHSHYYLDLVGRQASALRGRAPHTALNLIRTELENVRQAWQWAAGQATLNGRSLEALTAAVAALARFYHLAGLFHEARQHFLATLEAVQHWPASTAVTLLRGQLHLQASHFLGQGGQYEAAIEHAQAARRLVEAAGPADLLAATHSLEGEWRRHLGQFDQARTTLEQAIDLFTGPGPSGEVAHVLNEIGFVHLKQSQYPAALDAFSRALHMYEAVGDQIEISTTLGNIGFVHQLEAEYPQALDHLRRALAIAEEIDYRQGIVKHTLGFGSVYLEQGDIAAAHQANEKALQMAEGLGYVRGVINSLIQLGNTYTYQGQLEEALTWFQQARRQAEAAGLRDLLALVLGRQAIVLARRGDNQGAISHYQDAIQLCRDLKNQAELGRNLSNLGNIYLRLGDPEQARRQFEAGLAVARPIGARQTVATTLLALGNAHKRLGHYDQALSYYQQSLELSRALGMRAGIANNTGSIGLLHYEQGRYDAARAAYEEARQTNQEMGNSLTESLWRLNIGQVDMVTGRYESALAQTEAAITQFRALTNQRYLAMGLTQMAQILFRQEQLDLAQAILLEAVRAGEPIQENEVLFECHLLQARLSAAFDQPDAARDRLETMLARYGRPAEQAQIHYYLWRLAGNGRSKTQATALFQDILAATPNYQYRQLLNELLAA
jgi:DNA-binding SARP family transcriptional activator/predicted ATPase/Tfp pilus assembly protein PilF